MNHSEARIRIAGYVDGDLLRRGATRYVAPGALHRRVRDALRSKTARDDAWWRRLVGPAFAPVAGFASAVLLAGNVYLLAALPSKDERVAEDVVTSHVRSLMSARPIDVASSDQHTVKPWYAGKLDFSPPVTDFAPEGFALVGGRLDYVDARPVAALVYAHREHVIDVFVWPAPNSASSPPAQMARRGYNLMHSIHAGMSYWIASDLEAPDLMALERLLAASRAN